MKKRLFISAEVGVAYKVFPSIKFDQIANIFPLEIVQKYTIFSYNYDLNAFDKYDKEKNIHFIVDQYDEGTLKNEGINIGCYDYLVYHSSNGNIRDKFIHTIVGAHLKNNHTFSTVFNAIIEGGTEDLIINKIITELWPKEDQKLIDEFLTRIFFREKPSQILEEEKFEQYNFKRFKEDYQEFENDIVALQSKLINTIK